MTRKRYDESNQPSGCIRSQWGDMQRFDSGNSDTPVCRGRGTSYDDKPSYLFNERAHAGLERATKNRGIKEDLCWKHIIVCGDDFGMNSCIDTGMFQLARQGRLTAISCLTQGPSFAVNGRQLRSMNVDVGLHVNLTESFDHPDQLAVMPLATLIARAYTGRLDSTQLDKQLARQLDAFEKVMGRPPDYVDGHQHVHQLPGVLPCLLRVLTMRYGCHRPWLRHTAPGMLTGIPLNEVIKARTIGALGAGMLARIAGNEGWRTNRRLLGVYGLQGGPRHYARLLHRWLNNARDCDLLMCHPATIGANDKLASQRAAEFSVLACADLDDWMRQNGVKIVRPFWSQHAGPSH